MNSTDPLLGVIGALNFYYPIVLSISATIGNIISFIVFSSKAFKNNPSGLILKIKSLVDIANVYVGTLRFSYLSKTGLDLLNISQFVCHWLITSVYSIDAFSSWLSVFISLDRLFLILKPSTYQSISKTKFLRVQIISALVVWILIVFINLTKLSIIDYVPIHSFNRTDYKCTAMNQSLVDWINFTITLVVPFGLMLLSSSMMVYYLAKKSSRSRAGRNKHTGYIKTVLALDFCFLAFNLPRFLLQLNRSTSTTYSLMLQLSAILKYSLNAMTLILWLVTNNLFRSKIAGLISNQLSFRKRTQVRPAGSI